MNRSHVVSVALPLPIRRDFSYRVPERIPPPEAGTRVRVPFGERVLTGIVVGCEEGEAQPGLREILEVLDEEPVCPPDLLAAAERVAQRFFTSRGEVLKSALPSRLPAVGGAAYRITEKGALARASGTERDVLDRLRSGEAVKMTDLSMEGKR